MWDKIDIRIPFDAKYVMQTGSPDEQFGAIDPKRYDFPLSARIAFTNGQETTFDLNHSHWGAIASSISDMAVGFAPEGTGLYHWPHINIKASPTKILQGYNVFGTENIRQGVMQMLAYLEMQFPKIFAHLDI